MLTLVKLSQGLSTQKNIIEVVIIKQAGKHLNLTEIKKPQYFE